MAAIEHICVECGFVFFDNSTSEPCSRCGSDEFTSHFDEPFEVDDIRDSISEEEEELEWA